MRREILFNRAAVFLAIAHQYQISGNPKMSTMWLVFTALVLVEYFITNKDD